MNQDIEYTKRAARHEFTVVVRSGEYRDTIGGQPGETVEDVLARRFAHCGGKLPSGWSYEVVKSK